jgi:hypothetical protein
MKKLFHWISVQYCFSGLSLLGSCLSPLPPPIFVLQLDVVRFLAMDLASWVWLLPAAYALIFPEASSFLVLHPHQWISLFPFCIPNRFSCSSDRAPSSARTSLESWFCRWDFFVRVLPRRFQLPFSVFPPESAGRIFFPLLLLLISLLASVPQFLRFPLFFFCRRPSLARRGLAAQPLIFLSRVACIRAGQIQLLAGLPRSIHGRIFLLLQFSPLERPITVLHLSFSRRSSAIPGCCSWFRFSL